MKKLDEGESFGVQLFADKQSGALKWMILHGSVSGIAASLHIVRYVIEVIMPGFLY
jgi:hypothetical protein